MDALTAHYLARELDTAWRAERLAGLEVDRPARCVTINAGGLPVTFDLGQREVHVHRARLVPRGGMLVGWTVRAVSAPIDDRRLVIAIVRVGKFKGSHERLGSIEISVVPTARGAVVRDNATVVSSVGARLLRPHPPRAVLDDDAVARAALEGDTETLLSGRWVSGLVADWLIADAKTAAQRYRWLCELPPAQPTCCGPALVPFPFCSGGEPTDSLIGTAVAVAPSLGAEDPQARAVARMRRELERAAQAPRLRAAAETLQRLGDAPAPHELRVDNGPPVAIGDPDGEPLSARDAAARLHRRASAMERALAQLPARIEAMEKALGSDSPTRGAERGDLPKARAPIGRARADRSKARAHAGPARPYREYVSSGGLAIWVGRGAAANDTLTFHESAPDDVWLHARDAGGAHVVLRWPRSEPPPARDLEEAALLAAWHSKARGSTVVPVDWTRRRYVRKPRQAPPGMVIVQRAQTIFVRPSAGAEKRLRRE